MKHSQLLMPAVRSMHASYIIRPNIQLPTMWRNHGSRVGAMNLFRLSSFTSTSQLAARISKSVVFGLTVYSAMKDKDASCDSAFVSASGQNNHGDLGKNGATNGSTNTNNNNTNHAINNGSRNEEQSPSSQTWTSLASRLFQNPLLPHPSLPLPSASSLIGGGDVPPIAGGSTFFSKNGIFTPLVSSLHTVVLQGGSSVLFNSGTSSSTSTSSQTSLPQHQQQQQQQQHSSSSLPLPSIPASFSTVSASEWLTHHINSTITSNEELGVQLTFGGVAGFCSGYALKKIGRAMALVIGLGFIGVQVARYKGILGDAQSISMTSSDSTSSSSSSASTPSSTLPPPPLLLPAPDWNKANAYFIQILDADKDGKVTLRDLRAHLTNTVDVLGFNVPGGAAFASAFVLGLRWG